MNVPDLRFDEKLVEKKPLHALIIEDDADDAFLLVRKLKAAGYDLKFERVQTADEMRRALEKSRWDVILSDHAMPEFSAPEALSLMLQHGLDLPFIIVSGFIDDKTAIAAMEAGAHDYVMKDRLERLVPALERELREARIRQAHRSYAQELCRAREELETRVQQRTAELQQANAKLQDALEERKRLEIEILEIAEQEQRRIGFDLHDDLGQKMTGLSLLVKSIETRLNQKHAPEADELRKAHDLVTEIMNYTHSLASQFGRLTAEEEELGHVLEKLGQKIGETFGVRCDCIIDPTIPPLASNITVQLFKISQESVSNAIKHGKTKCITVKASQLDGALLLEITNDGRPFCPPTAPQNRMGLRIMKYRASTIGGELTIQPGETGGTVVRCALPLPKISKNTTTLLNGSNRLKPARTDAQLAAQV